MINRLIYFGYYLRKLDWVKLRLFQSFLKESYGHGVIIQWLNILFNSLTYNISILEYYQFRFFEKSHKEKLTWAGTGNMYEYQKAMNPIGSRRILDDKREFFKSYKIFFKHLVFSINDLMTDSNNIEELKKHSKIVFKLSNGKCGVSVKICATNNFDFENIVEFMEMNRFDMVESFVLQHSKLQELSPSAVNTVRIFTQLDENNNVEILGCRLRISINSHVDNLAAGNAAASIDEKLGVVNLPAVFSDITKKPIDRHPITGIQILGFQIPFWDESLNLAKKAALYHTENRSIGWDIVITESGPGLIEGNHDWCKLLWQLPVNQGLKQKLKIS